MRQAKYSEYQVQGTNAILKWSDTLNTIGRDGMRYSTADFYVRSLGWYSGVCDAIIIVVWFSLAQVVIGRDLWCVSG